MLTCKCIVQITNGEDKRKFIKLYNENSTSSQLCLLNAVLSWTPRRLVIPFILVTAESINPAGYRFTAGETKLQHKRMNQSAQAPKLVKENNKNLGNRLTGPFGHNIPLPTSSMKLNTTKSCHNHSFY